MFDLLPLEIFHSSHTRRSGSVAICLVSWLGLKRTNGYNPDYVSNLNPKVPGSLDHYVPMNLHFKRDKDQTQYLSGL